MKRLVSLALFFCCFTLGISAIVAQGPIMCPTRPTTDNSNACASTAFVWNFVGGSTVVNTVSSTDGSLTITPTSGAVTANLNVAHTNTWASPQGFNNNVLTLNGSTSGSTILNASPVASGTITVPSATDTLVARATTDTLSNKTLVAPVLGAATATTINGNTLTTGSWTLTGAASKILSFNNTLTFAGTDGTTMTFPSSSASIAALNLTSQNITGGAVVTTQSQATGNLVVDCGTRPIQTISNAGAFSITAPSNDGYCLLRIVNTASPSGAITWTGFSVGSNTGDPLTTTSGHKFIVSIIRAGGDSTYSIKALQ